jgi:hypothetical protein
MRPTLEKEYKPQITRINTNYRSKSKAPPPAAYANRPFRTLRHGVKAALGMLARSALEPAGGLPAAYAKRYFRTLRHGVKAALGMPARSAFKPTGGLPAAYAKRYFRTLRHGVKAALGMLARSALEPAGGRGAHVNPLAGAAI